MKKSVLACTIATIGFAMSCSIAAFADESTSPTPVTTPKKHHRHHGGFEFGICVGQALAKAGVVLPPRVPGEHVTPDAATQAAFAAAMESCHTPRASGK